MEADQALAWGPFSLKINLGDNFVKAKILYNITLFFFKIVYRAKKNLVASNFIYVRHGPWASIVAASIDRWFLYFVEITIAYAVYAIVEVFELFLDFDDWKKQVCDLLICYFHHIYVDMLWYNESSPVLKRFHIV